MGLLVVVKGDGTVNLLDESLVGVDEPVLQIVVLYHAIDSLSFAVLPRVQTHTVPEMEFFGQLQKLLGIVLASAVRMEDQPRQIDPFPESDRHFQGGDDRVLREKSFRHAVPDNHAGESIDDESDVVEFIVNSIKD